MNYFVKKFLPLVLLSSLGTGFYAHCMEIEEKTNVVEEPPRRSFDNVVPIEEIATGRSPHSAVVSPDKKTVLFVLYNGKAILWDIQTKEQLQEFIRPTGYIRAAAFSADGNFIFTGADDNTGSLWDKETGKELQKFTTESGIWTAAFSPDNENILVGLLNGSVELRNIKTGAPVKKFVLYDKSLGHVSKVAFSLNGRFIAAGFSNGVVYVWDNGTGELVEEFKIPGSVYTLAFSPDGTSILTGSLDDQTARLWEIATGKLVQEFVMPSSGSIYSVSFSSDGKFVLTAGDKGIVTLWEAASGKKIKEWAYHNESVIAMTLNSDDDTMITVSKDGEIVLWGS